MAVVVLTTLTAGGSLLLAPGGATAAPCDKPPALGNASTSVGDVAGVGIEHHNFGTTQQDTHVCVANGAGGNEVRVDVTDGPGHGATAAASSCYLVSTWYCTPVLGSTGAEVTPPATPLVPTPSVNPPLDGNGSVGATTGTGTLACAWVNGDANCGSASVSTGASPPNPGGLADHMVAGVVDAVGFVDFCLWLMNGQVVNGTVGCASVIAGYFVVSPALTVVSWLG